MLLVEMEQLHKEPSIPIGRAASQDLAAWQAGRMAGAVAGAALLRSRQTRTGPMEQVVVMAGLLEWLGGMGGMGL